MASTVSKYLFSSFRWSFAMQLFLSFNSADRTSAIAVQKLLWARGITTFLERGPWFRLGSSPCRGASNRRRTHGTLSALHPATTRFLL
jgi:hypothetical protein